jgi:hypothetical protein
VSITLPPFAVAGLLASVSQRLEEMPDFVVGGGAWPYLRRWYLTEYGDAAGVYLHQFLRSDDDRALHDHPYESTSIILAGGYLEHLGDGTRILRRAGDVVTRDAASPHRVQLLLGPDGAELPAVTLFIHGPRVRDWGFHCPQGWRPWQEFVSARDKGAVGVGCG